MREKPSLTVYHDGTCPLCAAEIALYQRARGAEAVMFLDAAAPDTEAELGPGLSREAVLARFHVRDGNGLLVSGAAAFTALWCTLPGWRWLGRVVRSRPILPLAELAYHAFLPLRPYIVRALTRIRRGSA